MITQQQAEQLVYEHINTPNPQWPDMPEMIVVSVEEQELGWLVFYDSRPHQETGEVRYAIAGNAPFLVSREDGAMFATGTAAPFAECVREAELRLKEHLLRHSTNCRPTSH
ncbi:MAG: YrhB domain-containing protein [Verrucomicrobiota bacterium]